MATEFVTRSGRIVLDGRRATLWNGVEIDVDEEWIAGVTADAERYEQDRAAPPPLSIDDRVAAVEADVADLDAIIVAVLS